MLDTSSGFVCSSYLTESSGWFEPLLYAGLPESGEGSMQRTRCRFRCVNRRAMAEPVCWRGWGKVRGKCLLNASGDQFYEFKIHVLIHQLTQMVSATVLLPDNRSD